MIMDDRDQYGHPRIPHRGYYEKQYCDERRRWAEKFCTCELKHVGQWWRDEGRFYNCTLQLIQISVVLVNYNKKTSFNKVL